MDATLMLREFCDAVERHDGKRFADLFCEDGVYHDVFYGEFAGRTKIAEMIDDLFFKSATDMRWDMHDPVCDGRILYARYAFSYKSLLPEAGGKRAMFEGVAIMRLRERKQAHLNPMVRIGALDMLESVPANQIWPLVSPLLSDRSRGVRIRAASFLAAVPTANQPSADREQFERAAAEFIVAQRFNADRPESRSALGSFFTKRVHPIEAEAEYKAALRLSPEYAPAAANLADLYRGLGREADGEGVLRAAVVASPQDAGLRHALGLTLVRLKRADDALAELHRAAELDPGQARYAYVYAVALHSSGHIGEAMTELKESLARHPNDRETLLALVSFSRDGGDARAALEYAERLAGIAPQDSALAALIEELRRLAGKQTPK
jgi:tetratricopeptide (TPR) repeat protein